MVKETEISFGHDASLRNKVFKYIKNQIISGQFNPGESLVESKLAEELGVSRTPIREAMHLLELEGLVETTPNKGTVVLGISPKDVEDIYAIRQLVDGLAARWAAIHITAKEITELQKIVDLMEFYAQRGDLDEIAKLDNKFHHLIFETSGSKILNLTLSNLHQYIQLARIESLKVPHRMEQSLSEHRSIIQAFIEGNADKAEQALSKHVKHAYTNYKKRGTQK